MLLQRGGEGEGEGEGGGGGEGRVREERRGERKGKRGREGGRGGEGRGEGRRWKGWREGGQHHVRLTHMFNSERKYLINRLNAFPLEACNN